jgi:hypothetical protein
MTGNRSSRLQCRVPAAPARSAKAPPKISHLCAGARQAQSRHHDGGGGGERRRDIRQGVRVRLIPTGIAAAATDHDATPISNFVKTLSFFLPWNCPNPQAKLAPWGTSEELKARHKWWTRVRRSFGSTLHTTSGNLPPKPILPSGSVSAGCSRSKRPSCKRLSARNAAAKAHLSSHASASGGHRPAFSLRRLSIRQVHGGTERPARARPIRRSRQA